MRLPRDLSGSSLIRHLAKLGCAVSRKSGSHVRLAMQERGEHHLNHDSRRIGTLSSILDGAVIHHGLRRDELLNCLLGR